LKRFLQIAPLFFSLLLFALLDFSLALTQGLVAEACGGREDGPAEEDGTAVEVDCGVVLPPFAPPQQPRLRSTVVVRLSTAIIAIVDFRGCRPPRPRRYVSSTAS